MYVFLGNFKKNMTNPAGLVWNKEDSSATFGMTLCDVLEINL